MSTKGDLREQQQTKRTKKNTEMIIALSMAVWSHYIGYLSSEITTYRVMTQTYADPTNAITTSVTPTPTEAPALKHTHRPRLRLPRPPPWQGDFEPVKALYLNSSSVQKNIWSDIDMANRTEINAYVIDNKKR